ncbi:MAG: baseplate J/gp47 family protein [Oscillospiraceae bacterium]|nr:baseplate J/gp47 family protein [Oscillospiraceae bacterium]
MRSIEEIYQSMLAAFAERAGFAPEEGCDLAVRLWAAAAEIQALGIQADWVLDQSFPQTAQGVYLDYHGTMRGLVRTPAAKAAGTLRFTVETALAADQTIPAGTVCMTAEETRFQTTKSAVLAAGELFTEAPAEALEGGGSGNAAPGAVCILTACPVAVTSCTNPAAFSGGRDAEDDASFRARILESYQRLPNGANAAWYEQTAMGYPGVAAAKAVGRARGIGTVDVYAAAEGGLPSAELLAGLQAELQEKREIAVDVEVKAPAVASVDVTVAVAGGEGVDFGSLQAAVEQTLTAFFTGRLLGKPVRLAELGSRLYALEGLENYRFSAPAADLAADDTVLPVLGTLRVTEMEERHV